MATLPIETEFVTLFDAMYESVQGKIVAEYNAGRITDVNYAGVLASALRDVINSSVSATLQNVAQSIDNDIKGLYQVTNGTPINKYELLMLFKKLTNKAIEIEAVEGRVTNKTLLDTRQKLSQPIPSYEDMLREMVNFMRAHPDLYAQYSL